MVFDITQLRKIRKQLDITQHAFAKEAGISQSMVAKIESGKLDPTYSYVRKIEDVIAKLTKHEEKEAKDVMCEKIYSVKKETKVKEIINMMARHEISQVLVAQRSNFIGLVTERSLLNIGEGESSLKSAMDVMVESPPIIDLNAKLSIAVELLKFYPLILVKKEGKLAGVITKSDVIKSLK